MIYDLPDLYDAQYKNYRDDLRFYTDLAEDYGSPVLELGSGTARISISLGKAGYKVIGIELSKAMLVTANKRIQEEKLEELVMLKQADMRSFKLEERFPLVIAPFNSLMHLYTLKDQDAAFACVKQCLAEGGLFAFDLYNPEFVNLEQLTKVDEWEKLGGANTEFFLYQTDDKDKQILTSKYYLDSVNKDGYLKRQTATLTQRYYYRFELERALRQAGFTHIRFFGDFDRSRFVHDSPHLIALVR